MREFAMQAIGAHVNAEDLAIGLTLPTLPSTQRLVAIVTAERPAIRFLVCEDA